MIYISGPITNNPDYVAQFEEAEAELLGAGYTVYNPVGNPLKFNSTHAEYMRRDLNIILNGDFAADENVDGIALLPGWADSAGAYVEKQVADIIGLPIKTVQAWVAASDTIAIEILPDTTRLRSAFDAAREKAEERERQEFLNDLSGRHTAKFVSFTEPPPQPTAHYAIDGEEVIPLVPPYLKHRAPHEPPETVAVEKMDHQIAEQETRDDLILPPVPACKHLWLVAETSDGIVKECPNCGETKIERRR